MRHGNSSGTGHGLLLLKLFSVTALVAGLLMFNGALRATEQTRAAGGVLAGQDGNASIGEGREYEVPPPPLSDYFPCSMCHEDMEVNRERRELTEEHLEIELRHDEEHRWCLDCHDADNRDVLRLASGTPVEFTESYVLCGQCHGPKIRDWRAGVHGKRTGHWRGDKQYLLCVHCHDPHAPRFKPMKPMPPPVRPENLR